MSEYLKISVVLLALIACFAIAIMAPAPGSAYCADGRDCLVTKPRVDGSLDPETIYQSPLKLYNQQGEFRGNLSNNPYDPLSTSDSYGRFGSQYSNESLSNKYGAGSPWFGNTTLQDDED